MEEDCEHARLEYFRALDPPTVDEFRAASLHEICAYVGREERETTLERLTAYLLDMFPPRLNRLEKLWLSALVNTSKAGQYL